MPLAYASGVSPIPLLGQTLGENFEQAVARDPKHEALVVRHQGVRKTYGELDEEVNRVARGLIAAGLVKGDRLGIWAPNVAEWVVVQLATAKLGIILVNINPAYRTHELAFALEQSGCRMLIAATSFKTSDYARMVSEVRDELTHLERVVFIGTAGWTELLEAGNAVPATAVRERMAELSFDEPINIQYTSGTTGSPKGATLSHHNILNNAYFCGEGLAYTARDRVCIPVPFYHCFGMVLGNLACIAHGATMVVPAPVFDPLATLETVEAERCTSLYGVPTMFIAMLGHAEFRRFDLSALRTGIMAGAPCPIEVMKQCISDMHMEQVVIAYGMTETSPLSTQTAVGDPLEKRVGTVGRVHPHVEVKIVDPATGLTVERGASGELCTRGYSVMLGYWNEPEKTAESVDGARWMHTGDLAVMDDEGYVNIVGRIKDMIIRGGENVFPREIEEFLYTHPAIAEVQVIGVPDARYGEEVMAWIKLRAGAQPLSAESVRAYCKDRIAHYKIPRYVHVTDEFPLTVTGKVQKFRLREVAIELLGLEQAARVRTA